MTHQCTPGPWQIKELKLGEGFEISGTEYTNDYALCSSIGKAWEEEDARLIAAAPDLLAVLEDLEKVGMSIQPNSVIWGDIRSAISKAKGE